MGKNGRVFHIARYPAMQIQDVHKLIHQAALGSEHAISSVVGARRWLLQELAEMGTGREESMIDPISADGQIVRAHLRPFIAQGGDPEILLNAILRTAHEFRGDPQNLKIYWHTAQDLRHFPQAAMHAFIESMQAREFPAVHHTPENERLYRPAYRVVWRKFVHEWRLQIGSCPYHTGQRFIPVKCEVDRFPVPAGAHVAIHYSDELAHRK